MNKKWQYNFGFSYSITSISITTSVNVSVLLCSPPETCITLLWNYYCFWHKRGQKRGNSKIENFYIFSSNCNAVFFAKWSSLWVIKSFAILFRKRVQILHIWKVYISLIKQDKCPKYKGSSILLCPHLLLRYICSTFLFVTCCDHTMLRSAWPFISNCMCH